MESVLAILAVSAIHIVPPVLIGLGIVGFALGWERFKETRRQRVSGLACRADTDCAPGYICRDGLCLPANS